jgi:hypothetical protein
MITLGTSGSAPITPPFSFQLIPLISVIPKSTRPNTSCIQDLDLVMNDQIVQCPWEQIALQSPPNMDNPIDAKQLDALVQMASYMPFDTINN